MENKELIEKIVTFAACSTDNIISAEDSISPTLAGMRIYDEPIVGFAHADDELFTAVFKKDGIIHPEYLSPTEWLPGAKSVISVFFPFTKEVRVSNRKKTDEPYEPGIPQRCSTEWLHARIEGQIFLDRATDAFQPGLARKQAYGEKK